MAIAFHARSMAHGQIMVTSGLNTDDKHAAATQLQAAWRAACPRVRFVRAASMREPQTEAAPVGLGLSLACNAMHGRGGQRPKLARLSRAGHPAAAADAQPAGIV